MFTSKHFVLPHFYSEHFTDFGEGLFIFSIDAKNALDYLAPGSLKISRHMNNRSTASFTLIGIGGYSPLMNQEIIIEHSPCKGVPFKRVFAGHLRDITSECEYTGRTVFHKVTCVDYNALLDKRLVFNIYDNQPVQDVVLAIVRDYLKGENITTKNVDCKNLMLEKAVFSYVKASKAFNDISTNTGLFWYIDFYRDLHFFLRSTQTTGSFLYPAPIQSDYCSFIKSALSNCSQGIRSADISVEKRSDQLVNHQFIIAGKDETDLLTEQFAGDGERTTFSVRYPVSTVKLNADKTIAPDAVKVNGVNQTIGVRDESDVYYQWYFSKGENTISQNQAETVLTSGKTLEVIYKGLKTIVRQYKDPTGSINKYKKLENTSGLYQDVEDDESIESGKYALQFAKGRVRKFAYVPVTVKFSSDSQVLEIGEVLSVKLDDYGIDIKNGFVVNSVEISDLSGVLKRFKYELISGENLGDWQEYYRKIEFFGRQLKLREQQKLIVGDDNLEGILMTQTFTSSLGISTLEVQNKSYERSWCHIGRNLHLHNMHLRPQVKVLGLI
jgi:hypothetical protein